MDPLICFPVALIGYWLYDLLTNMGPPIPDDREWSHYEYATQV